MSHDPPVPDWFIDIRSCTSPEQISLDLTRHLPRRATVGPVAIICDRPTVLHSVIRKRWSVLVREVQRQYSSTLQATKKQGLRRELERLQSFVFAEITKRQADTNVLFARASELVIGDMFDTIYLTIPMAHRQLHSLMQHLNSGGFLVSYTGWPDIIPDKRIK